MLTNQAAGVECNQWGGETARDLHHHDGDDHDDHDDDDHDDDDHDGDQHIHDNYQDDEQDDEHDDGHVWWSQLTCGRREYPLDSDFGQNIFWLVWRTHYHLLQ